MTDWEAVDGAIAVLDDADIRADVSHDDILVAAVTIRDELHRLVGDDDEWARLAEAGTLAGRYLSSDVAEVRRLGEVDWQEILQVCGYDAGRPTLEVAAAQLSVGIQAFLENPTADTANRLRALGGEIDQDLGGYLDGHGVAHRHRSWWRRAVVERGKLAWEILQRVRVGDVVRGAMNGYGATAPIGAIIQGLPLPTQITTAVVGAIAVAGAVWGARHAVHDGYERVLTDEAEGLQKLNDALEDALSPEGLVAHAEDELGHEWTADRQERLRRRFAGRQVRLDEAVPPATPAAPADVSTNRQLREAIKALTDEVTELAAKAVDQIPLPSLDVVLARLVGLIHTLDAAATTSAQPVDIDQYENGLIDLGAKLRDVQGELARVSAILTVEEGHARQRAKTGP